MSARTIMVQGTMSSVGKSLLVAALCRILKQDGRRVAPFKAQNMALNSFATADGREVGRAQAMQAQACGIDVTVEMNPVLIKPEADALGQIVVMGRPWARLTAGDYLVRRKELWETVTHALESLRSEYEIVVIEGAGGPAELNLRDGDIVNMPIAEYAGAPVLLAGDIDRGGIFAQLLGTLWLLPEAERARVRGFLVNKFRGDPRLFEDGVKILQARGRVPVLGVIPFIPDLRIADEDSVALDTRQVASDARDLHVVVLRLPHISNFDDTDPLWAEPSVRLRFVDRPEEFGEPDLIILPGTKTTISDLAFLRERGLARRVVELAHRGTAIIGICGGLQMLGASISDPDRVESEEVQVQGLGLLPLETTFAEDKRTVRARGRLLACSGLFAGAEGLELSGYEIHMGRTVLGDPRAAGPLIRVENRDEIAGEPFDGAVSSDGWIVGTYFHGLFESDSLRHLLLRNLAARRGLALPGSLAHFDRESEYDRLAAVVRAHVNMSEIYRLLGL